MIKTKYINKKAKPDPLIIGDMLSDDNAIVLVTSIHTGGNFFDGVVIHRISDDCVGIGSYITRCHTLSFSKIIGELILKQE